MTPQQKAAQQASNFVSTFNTVILYPTIALLSAVAFLIFLWGCVEYFMNSDNDQARQNGVKHMTWGIIGLVIMVSAWAVLTIVANTFGLGQELSCADDPSSTSCASVFTTPAP